MKKYFIFILLVVASMALVSCDKGKDQNNAEDPQESSQTTPQDSTEANPYPYLRVEDLAQLQLISIADAEAKLKEMGYKGGWRVYKDSYGHEHEDYLYTSSNNSDSIFLYTDSINGVYLVHYLASKSVVPSDAKAWLSHIPENYPLQERAKQISGLSEIPFSAARFMGPSVENEIPCSTYVEYLKNLNDLSSGMVVEARWGLLLNGCGVNIGYMYKNEQDAAYLVMAFRHQEQKNTTFTVDPSVPVEE